MQRAAGLAPRAAAVVKSGEQLQKNWRSGACVSRPALFLVWALFNMRVSFHTLKLSFAFCAALLATDWSFSSSLFLAKRKRVFTDTP